MTFEVILTSNNLGFETRSLRPRNEVVITELPRRSWGGGRSNIGGGPQQPLSSMQWGCCWSSIIWNSEVNGARWKGNFSINFSLFNQKCWLSPLKTFRWKDDYFRFIKLLCSFWSFWTLEYLTTIFSEEWDFNWNFKLSYFKKGP